MTRISTRPMSEAEWQQRITDLCDLLGLRWHHETDSRRSKSGFPDLVIVGDYGVIFAELKSEKGKVTAEQEGWIGSIGQLASEDVTADVWRPSDWPKVYRALYRIAGKKPPPGYDPASEVRHLTPLK